jgi:hypothetical protein
MKLAPFFLQKKETPLLIVYRLTLFLSDGGKTLWEIGPETDQKVIHDEYLKENDMMPLNIQQWNHIYFAELDPLKTNRKLFYTWEEIQDVPEKRREDCFRTFVFCFEKQEQKLWFHSDICDQPFEGSVETPNTLFQGLKDLYCKEVE